MRRRMAALAALAMLVPAAAAAQEEERAVPTAWLGFSYSAFTQYFDGDGRRHPLDDAFGDPLTGAGAHRVRVDASVLTFGGRLPITRRLSAALEVPLVAVDRTGTRSIGGLGAESLYAHALAAGDLRGELRARVIGQDEAFVDARVLLQLPSGSWRNLGSDELPTGSGSVGAGGEAIARGNPGRSELSLAAGTMAFFPRTVGVDVERGVVQWLDARAGVAASRARFGVAIEELSRGGDRRGHQRIASLEDGGEPGALAPPSWLVSAGLYAQVPIAGHDAFEASILAPADGWLFVPAQTGIAIAGHDVMASATVVRFAYHTRF